MRKINAILIFSAIITFTLSPGCMEDSDSNLSPARKISGTWKTTFPVKFYIKTDFCSANPELVASQDRMVTMEIEDSSEYTVDITFTFSGSNFTVLDQDCNPTGYVPDVSPMFLKGSIASTQLTIMDSQSKVLGIFNFTTDLMEGTWSDLWCSLYCQEVYSDSNALKLVLTD